MLCNKTVKITFCGHRDVIEYNGKQWRVAQTGFNMSFENLDENDSEQMFSHIGGMESFKASRDYTLITEKEIAEK